MGDVNKTQPRRLVRADSDNVMPGDLYLSLYKTLKYVQSIGIVTNVESNGFCCLYNHMNQDKKKLQKYMTDNEYRERHPTDHFFDCESGIFLRRQEDGRLELIAATSKFLGDLEVLESMHRDFLKRSPKPND